MTKNNTFDIPVLKVEVCNDVLLNSRDAKQEIAPETKYDVSEFLKKNINSELLLSKTELKFKTVIETQSDINIDALRNAYENKAMCKIYSIAQLVSQSIPKLGNYVNDSLEYHDKIYNFRPIFRMYLTHFVCKVSPNGEQIWKLEFSQT